METLFGKFISMLSRYEIITNLIPGALLVYILNQFGIPIWSDNIYFNIAACYFVGMVNNRFSSLCIEEPLKKIGWIKWREYGEYNTAKKERPFIVTLQEMANQFRAMTAVFLLSILGLLYKLLASQCNCIMNYGYVILIVLLFVLFIFSYRKQINDYVVKNIDEVTGRKE